MKFYHKYFIQDHVKTIFFEKKMEQAEAAAANQFQAAYNQMSYCAWRGRCKFETNRYGVFDRTRFTCPRCWRNFEAAIARYHAAIKHAAATIRMTPKDCMVTVGSCHENTWLYGGPWTTRPKSQGNAWFSKYFRLYLYPGTYKDGFMFDENMNLINQKHMLRCNRNSVAYKNLYARIYNKCAESLPIN